MGLVVEVNDKNITSPICWEETNTGQYQRFKALKEPDLLSAFCALNEQDFKVIAETVSDEIESVLYQCASFVFTEGEYFRTEKPPTHFKLGGKTILVPTKLGSLTIMQNLILRQLMGKPGVCLEQLISMAVAVYLQPLVDDDKFSLDRAKELEKEILLMPIVKTFPVGFFYLSKLNNFGRFGLLAWFQRQLRRTSLGRWLLRCLMCSALILSMSYPSLSNTLLHSINSQESLNKNRLTMLYPCCGSGKNALSTTNDTAQTIKP